MLWRMCHMTACTQYGSATFESRNRVTYTRSLQRPTYNQTVELIIYSLLF
jgi:hypothetical protein